MRKKIKTYISLFSSAGVGCYGFKLEGFECIATNELVQRRLNIQKFNSKCKYESGYICGDITKEDTKEEIFKQIKLWGEKEEIENVDVVIATPPCQGMSVANHKRHKNEIIRNSLVIESINIIKKIKPNIFIFENVSAFLKTACTDNDGKIRTIEDAIDLNLGKQYLINAKVLNFKNYGSNSSRTRTLVIGVRNDLSSIASPIDLFPDYREERTLREVIGDLPRLSEFHEFSNDIYHFFRNYSHNMRPWISHTPEGKSAFDNNEIAYIPHQIIDGVPVINVRKNGGKYTRVFWDKVGPCIHTRNDQIASQNTIHPEDDRVFSIREIMRMMTVPDSFKWSNVPINVLNQYSQKEKISFMKKEEINIRQSLGEAVPTAIFQEIARKINTFFYKKTINNSNPKKIVAEFNLNSLGSILSFINNHSKDMNFGLLQKIAEYANLKRNKNSAYYTDKELINIIEKYLPDIKKEEINILEPSVGVGNFIPLIIKKYESKKVNIDVVDIDNNSIEILKKLMDIYGLPANFHINFIVGDFLEMDVLKHYDLVVGNPPFTRIKTHYCGEYYSNLKSHNLSSYFLEKACHISNYVCMVMPKNLLNSPEYYDTRAYLNSKKIEAIVDFGEKGFKGVLVETICISLSNQKSNFTKIYSLPRNEKLIQNQKYFTDKRFPYWIIYRNNFFDSFCESLVLDIFIPFRDRQLTNSNLNEKGEIRVIKSRNISDDGSKILNIKGYDTFINYSQASKFTVFKFYYRDDVYLTPNMTYKTRVIRKPVNTLVNGSVAILELKKNFSLNEQDLLFFSSNEYRKFMNIARNYQTRSLNINSCSVYFFGKRR